MPRDQLITFSVSKEEKEQLREKAIQMHLKLSSFCRMRLFSEETVSYKRSNNNVPITRVKNNSNHIDPVLVAQKTAHSQFKSEVQKELYKKLKEPKQSLKKISKKELREITKRKQVLALEGPEERKARWLAMSEQLQQLKLKNKAKV